MFRNALLIFLLFLAAGCQPGPIVKPGKLRFAALAEVDGRHYWILVGRKRDATGAANAQFAVAVSAEDSIP